MADMNMQQNQQVGDPPSKQAMARQIQSILETMPPEAIIEIAKMPAEEAIDQLIEIFVREAGMSERDAAMMARLLYEEISTMAQVQSNMTLDELQPEGPPPIDGGQQGPPQAPPMRGNSVIGEGMNRGY